MGAAQLMFGSPYIRPAYQQIGRHAGRQVRGHQAVGQRHGLIQQAGQVRSQWLPQEQHQGIAITRSLPGVHRQVCLCAAQRHLGAAQVDLAGASGFDQLRGQIERALLCVQCFLSQAQQFLVGPQCQIGVRHFGDQAQLGRRTSFIKRQIGRQSLFAQVANASPQINFPGHNARNLVAAVYRGVCGRAEVCRHSPGRAIRTRSKMGQQLGTLYTILRPGGFHVQRRLAQIAVVGQGNGDQLLQ